MIPSEVSTETGKILEILDNPVLTKKHKIKKIKNIVKKLKNKPRTFEKGLYSTSTKAYSSRSDDTRDIVQPYSSRSDIKLENSMTSHKYKNKKIKIKKLAKEWQLRYNEKKRKEKEKEKKENDDWLWLKYNIYPNS